MLPNPAKFVLVVQRHTRLVLPVMRFRIRIGQRFFYLPFSQNLYSDWLGLQLSKTRLEWFNFGQEQFAWTGFMRPKPWGLEFHTFVEVPSDVSKARAQAFSERLQKNLGAGWKVVEAKWLEGI
jgi:hypothetical protein